MVWFFIDTPMLDKPKNEGFKCMGSKMTIIDNFSKMKQIRNKCNKGNKLKD